jgi:hypothetical protein
MIVVASSDNIYNTNYIIKSVGYFNNYIYTYKDYAVNKKILSPALISNQIGILYIIYKNKIEENLSGILYFDFFYDYNNFVDFVDSNISAKLSNIDMKEIKHLLIVIKIWIYEDIYIQRRIDTSQKEFDKKLLKFQKVVNKLVEYKVNTSNGTAEFSRFLANQILTKELKPVLHIKVQDEIEQEDCLSHLLNLLNKKWPGVQAVVFKDFFHKAIKQHQDNFEHKDMW